MAIIVDIELVSIAEGEPPDEYAVTFDTIYSGETWCRSTVGVGSGLSACLERDQHRIVQAARDALLELLISEFQPVSFRLRLTAEGTTVLARAVPGS